MYCKKLPRVYFSIRAGTKVGGIQVITRSYPIMSELSSVFYTRVNEHRVKSISIELFSYLDPIVLAYWAMDDGAAITKFSGFYLHTKGFTFNEVYLLAGILHYRFGLVCTVQNHTGRPVLNITSKSMPLFIKLVKPYFVPSIMYKLQGYIKF